jgi:tetratricopeptide (TPR) repeat protein
MFSAILYLAAALLTFGMVTITAAADDRSVCGMGTGDDSIAACTRLILRNPRDTVAYNNRCWTYNNKGDHDRALADCDRAIRLDPKTTNAYNNRCVAYNGKGDYDSALADCDQAIRLNPKASYTYGNRCWAYNGKGDYDSALADCDQAIRLDPTIVWNYSHRCWAYSGKSEYDRALADCDQAIQLDPRLASAYEHRGNAYEKKRDYRSAMADYDQLLRLDPNNAFARERRESVLALLAAPRPGQPAPGSGPGFQSPQTPPRQPATFAILAERRVALVIGNSRYAFAPVLPNPRRDAEAVAKALREDGFQTVMLVPDAGRDTLRQALREFRAEADKAAWGLVYYAGHGIQTGKTNYLIPVDATLADERDVQGETIAYSEVEAAVRGASTLRIIILDACRNNPLEAQMARANPGRALSRGLLPPPEADAGMLVVYSTKDGETADDGDGANSPFATALVAQLKVPGREVRRMFDYVREEVTKATGKRQQPFTYGSLPGSKDYYFVAGK